eukprot:1189551-Prorocentrum_minimum.AAC.2
MLAVRTQEEAMIVGTPVVEGMDIDCTLHGVDLLPLMAGEPESHDPLVRPVRLKLSGRAKFKGALTHDTQDTTQTAGNSAGSASLAGSSSPSAAGTRPGELQRQVANQVGPKPGAVPPAGSAAPPLAKGGGAMSPGVPGGPREAAPAGRKWKSSSLGGKNLMLGEWNAFLGDVLMQVIRHPHNPLTVLWQSHIVHRCFVRDLDQSKEPVRCTRSLLLGILGVRNVGNVRRVYP